MSTFQTILYVGSAVALLDALALHNDAPHMHHADYQQPPYERTWLPAVTGAAAPLLARYPGLAFANHLDLVAAPPTASAVDLS